MVNLGGDLNGIELEPGDTITVNGNDWTYESDGTLSGPALHTEQVHIDQLGQYVYQTRDAITTEAVDRTVDPAADSITVTIDGTDHEYWIPDIPERIVHGFVLRIPDGDYSDINVFIPPFSIGDVVGVDDAGNGNREGASQVPWIRGNKTSPTNVKFRSITVVGTQGAISPLVEGMNIIGSCPAMDEPPGISTWGCQNVSFRNISFAGNGGGHGFLIYSSTATIRENVDLGANDLSTGIVTKHQSTVTADSYEGNDSLTGSVAGYVVNPTDGAFITLQGVSATGGNARVDWAGDGEDSIVIDFDNLEFYGGPFFGGQYAGNTGTQYIDQTLHLNGNALTGVDFLRIFENGSEKFSFFANGDMLVVKNEDTGDELFRIFPDSGFTFAPQNLANHSSPVNSLIYKHDGEGTINADGSTTSSAGYYAWSDGDAEYKSIVQY